MKYIKKYEKVKLNNNLKIGDYVICCVEDSIHEELNDFLMPRVGRIIFIENKIVEPYVVLFDENKKDYPELGYCLCDYDYGYDIDKVVINFDSDEIKNYDENKEKLELLLVANKYNL